MMSDQEIIDLHATVLSWGTFSGEAALYTTYPDVKNDSRQVALHSACCELEKRGMMERVIDKPEYVKWRANQKASDDVPKVVEDWADVGDAEPVAAESGGSVAAVADERGESVPDDS